MEYVDEMWVIWFRAGRGAHLGLSRVEPLPARQ